MGVRLLVERGKVIRVAVICFDNPYNNPMEGGKRSIKTRVEALVRLGYKVDLYIHCKREEGINMTLEPSKYGVERIFQFLNGRSVEMLFSKYPLSVCKRFSKECVDRLKETEYEAVIYEGEHVAKYRFNNVVNAKRHILYMHDIESVYREELSKSSTNLLEKKLQLLESRKYVNMEKKLVNYFDKMLFVSFDEMMVFQKSYPDCLSKFIYSPYAISRIADKIIRNSNSKMILYIGNLKLKNNYLSLKQFCLESLPAIEAKCNDVEIKIIGDLTEKHRFELSRNSRSIEVLGYVDDLDAYINSASFIICPVLFGAGVKVKTIDAISSGQIVVANSKSIEGTRLVKNKHIIIEDDSVKIAQRCIEILSNRSKFLSIAEDGLSLLRIEHSLDYHMEVLQNAIEM